MVTVDPSRSSVPADGSCFKTIPSRSGSTTSFLTSFTAKPAPAKISLALATASPHTRGTSDDGGSPVLISSRTIVPTATDDPPPGDCETTVPLGWTESTIDASNRKPAVVSFLIARPFESPTTRGTSALGGGGGSGKFTAGIPAMTRLMYARQIGAANVPPNTSVPK